MIAGKVFLQILKSETDPSLCSTFFRLNLVLNGLFYDQLKQFHTKYFCLTPTDILTLELVQSDSDQLLGTATVNDLYKLILQHKTVEIKIKPRLCNFEVLIKLNFNTLGVNPKNGQMPSPNRKLMDTSYLGELEKTSNNVSFSRVKIGTDIHSGIDDQTLFARATMTEGDSLQSLAQQRQKILGELFGKFKRDR